MKIGQTVKAAVDITDLKLSRKSATLGTTYILKENVVIEGEAYVLVPSRS